MFEVAYLEADEAKRTVMAAGASVRAQSAPTMQLSGTEVSLYLPAPTVVEIEVYDVSGRAVLGLGHRVVSAGDHAWDLRQLLSDRKASSGLYFVRVTAAGKRFSGKVVFVR